RKTLEHHLEQYLYNSKKACQENQPQKDLHTQANKKPFTTTQPQPKHWLSLQPWETCISSQYIHQKKEKVKHNGQKNQQNDKIPTKTKHTHNKLSLPEKRQPKKKMAGRSKRPLASNKKDNQS
ncbi:14285_t:CDS:1, partial [Acaulospora morrowiae]